MLSTKNQTEYLKSKDEKLALMFDILEKDFELKNKNKKEKFELEKLEIKNTIYEDLLSSIISQQISVKAAQAIEKKFLDLFKKKTPKEVEVMAKNKLKEISEKKELKEKILWPSHDVILNTKDEILKSAGLSTQKISYIKNVAEYFKENNLNQDDFAAMLDSEIIEKLTQIKGVGQWTVEMLLMFTLGRQDIFSIKDGGLVNGIVKLYKLEKYKPVLKAELDKMNAEQRKYIMKRKDFENKILKITEKWAPYRTLASRYIWKYKDLK